MIYPSGDKYLGEWLNNKMHGNGIYTYKDGRIYDGEFRDDKKHGKANFIYDDGTGDQ